jgi:hypothetical protein
MVNYIMTNIGKDRDLLFVNLFVLKYKSQMLNLNWCMLVRI